MGIIHNDLDVDREYTMCDFECRLHGVQYFMSGR